MPNRENVLNWFRRPGLNVRYEVNKPEADNGGEIEENDPIACIKSAQGRIKQARESSPHSEHLDEADAALDRALVLLRR
ncbi:MAG TPA: hypothetical protein VI479_14850 [Blastocatellia bacterium]